MCSLPLPFPVLNLAKPPGQCAVSMRALPPCACNQQVRLSLLQPSSSLPTAAAAGSLSSPARAPSPIPHPLTTPSHPPTPPTPHRVLGLHPHCTPPPPSLHAAALQAVEVPILYDAAIPQANAATRPYAQLARPRACSECSCAASRPHGIVHARY